MNPPAPLVKMTPVAGPCACALLAICLAVGLSLPASAAEPASASTTQRPLPQLLAGIFTPPAEFAGELGPYRSPLQPAGAARIATPAQWKARRQEILRDWHQIMGPWPPLLEKPAVEILATSRREGMTQHKVRLEVAPRRTTVAYLLVPDGKGPFPGVVVPYYVAETGAGLDDKEERDFGYQLTRRGFVSLSLGTPGLREYPSKENVQLQPLSYLAYVAANCHTALAQRADVDEERIGIVGHSYGGKWALFASCLYEKFACAAWSDPGIVFDETRSNVNYWEPWYLGHDPQVTRREGIPSDSNPRTGAYKLLMERGRDLHELHALMAPRPFLVSGGAEDRPQRWIPLNHAVAVNELLGVQQRVAMINRPKHGPRPEDNQQVYAFFEYFLKR